MKILKYVFLALLICICLSACTRKPSLKEEVLALKQEWGFEFPLLSKNDSINLLHIQMEKAYFTLEREKMDSLAKKILAIDSTFYMALSFQAFQKWPFDLEKLKKAKKYSLKDTTVQRLIFDGDYSYWIEHDSITALKKYTEVYKRYPNSKIAAWLVAMASMWTNDYNAAISYLKRSMEIDPTFYYAYLDMGDAYLQSKQYDKAIESFNLLLQHFPAKYRIHKYIGDAYLGLNDSIKAKEHYHIVDSLNRVTKK
ncbi:MAG: tetratricopeptide repeat protein [Bacteroidia bacterium]|nr:tetratricopeptide repeat protein [Bacteroidia bacterium]